MRFQAELLGGQLVRRYKRRAAGFALGWTGNHDDALDLSQEAFARAYGALSRFDPDRPELFRRSDP